MMRDTLRKRYQSREAFARYTVDLFILEFVKMLDKCVRDSGFTYEGFDNNARNLFEYLWDVSDVEVNVSDGIFLHDTMCNVSPQLSYLINYLSNSNIEDELCKKLSCCKSPSANLILFIMYCIYGKMVFENKALYTRLKNIHSVRALYIQSYHSSYNTIGVKELLMINKNNKDLLKHIINEIGSMPEGNMQKIDGDSSIDNMIGQIYEKDTIPFNNFMVFFAGTDTLKNHFLQQIMETRDTKYVQAFKNIYKSLYYGDRRGVGLFAAYVGGEFAEVVEKSEGVLYKYFMKEIDGRELSDKFDDVLRQEKYSFKTLMKYGIGIGIQDNINITKRRYLKILALSKRSGYSAGKGCIGPFIEVECPYLSLKVVRRDINAKKPQR